MDQTNLNGSQGSQEPQSVDRFLKVTDLTNKSITIAWDRVSEGETGGQPVDYEVWLKENDDADSNWQKEFTASDIDSYTFLDLNPNTEYAFFVFAIFGNQKIKYPSGKPGDFMMAMTDDTDVDAPTVDSDEAAVTEIGSHSFSIQWEEATDDVTASRDIRYQVALKEHLASEDAWRVQDAQEAGFHTFTELRSGEEYDFFVKAFDEAGNALKYSVGTVKTEDDEAPVVESKELTFSKITNNSVNVKWEKAIDNVTDPKDIRYSVYIKEAGISDCAWKKVTEKKNIGSTTVNGLAAAREYVFHVEASDESGNILSFSDGTAKTVDDIAPTAGSKELKASGISASGFTISWSPASDNVTAAKQIHYQVYLIADGKESLKHENDGITSYSFTGLKAATQYGAYVKATDEAGNPLTYSQIKATTLDNIAPTAGSTALKVSNITAKGFSVEWQPATDNVTAAKQILYQVYLFAGGKWLLQKEARGISSYTFTGLEAYTQYYVYVKAFDEANNVLLYPGNNATTPVKTLDDKAPTVGSTAITVTNRTRNSIAIQWAAASDNVTPCSQIRYEVYLNGTLKQNTKGISSYTFTGLTPNTQYSLSVKAFDEAGNPLQYPAITAKTLDDKAPTVGSTSITVSERTRNSISIRWTAASDNDTAASQIRYEVYLTTGSSWVLKQNARGITSYAFTGLNPNTQYSFYVKAFDEAGNALSYSCASAKTLDNQAPKAGSTTINVTKRARNSISIQWAAASDNDTAASQIRYEVYLTSGSSWVLKQNARGITSYTFTGLTPNTQYSFYVKAFDEANNAFQYPGSSAKTLDDKAPTVSSTSSTVSERARNSIAIRWTAASDNDTAASQIRYEVYLNGTLKCNTRGISSYTFTGLTPNTQYSFSVKAFDQADNVLQYTSSSVKTLDDKAPTVSNKAITISNLTYNSFKASWMAASDNDTASSQICYRVYLYVGGTWVKKAEGSGITSYTFTGLSSSTSYSVYVQALDAAGNSITYPSTSARTKAAPVNRLAVSVRQGATVLRGTNTICLEMTYKYVQYNSAGVVTARQQSSWKYKWSNTSTATTVIQLPAGWYIENNQVYIYIDSRRAASAGLNKWKKCSDGYVDVTGGSLILQLSGSYYSYSVRFTQIK